MFTHNLVMERLSTTGRASLLNDRLEVADFDQPALTRRIEDPADLASVTEFDKLMVTGNAAFEGNTAVYLLGSYRPTLGDSFSFLSVGGALQVGNPLNWAILRLVNPNDPSDGWTLWANAGGIYDANVPSDWRASIDQGTLSITAVPEPGTWALWLAGRVVVVRIARRQQA